MGAAYEQDVTGAAARTRGRRNRTQQHGRENREGSRRCTSCRGIRRPACCLLSPLRCLGGLLLCLLHALLCLLWTDPILGSHKLIQTVTVLLRQAAVGHASGDQCSNLSRRVTNVPI